MLKQFLKYYLSSTFNWGWLLTTIVATIVLCVTGYNREAPIYFMMALVPFFLSLYSLIDEYNVFRSFKFFKGKTLINITALACASVILTIVILMLT